MLEVDRNGSPPSAFDHRRCGRAAGDGAPPLPRRLPPGRRRLRLFNPHTGETFDGPYRDETGPIAGAMEDLSVFLRDFHSGETIDMDVGVVDFLAAVMETVGEVEAAVFSAYRTRATNEMLARTNFGVAENSQHIYGRALDIHLGNKLPQAMEAARGMQHGGVGWYPHSGFMHIDTGPVRNWDLDESGLGSLLFGGRQIHFNEKGELVISMGHGRGIPLMANGGGHPPTVRQRMARLRAVARAEFLARRH